MYESEIPVVILPLFTESSIHVSPTAAFLAPVLLPTGLCAMDIPTALLGTNVFKLSWPQL